MLVSQTSPVVSYETQSRLAKIEIADGSVSEKAIENKKTKWYSRRIKEAIHIRLYANDINRDSVLRFLKRGCLQSDNRTTDIHRSGPLREQYPPLTKSKMLWIEPTDHERGL